VVQGRPGCEKIVRYAFEYARQNRRKKVTCFTKDNIMKMTDGLFHRVFDEVGAEYPDLEKEHWIVDIGAAKLADTPETFDVIVMPNLYGDILSDVAAQIAGSVGLAGSANVGDGVAMFEAIHGSAPRRAGQDLANPSGLLLAGVMMLNHVGQADVAERVHNAWLRTVEDGIHTYDVYAEGVSKRKVGTREFAREVARRLGQDPGTLNAVRYAPAPATRRAPRPAAAVPRAAKETLGVDVFLQWSGGAPAALGDALARLSGAGFTLKMITNRGVKVWPDGFPETFCVDHWRCRFLSTDGRPVTHRAILELLGRVESAGYDFVKTENLCSFDRERGWSLGQGE